MSIETEQAAKEVIDASPTPGKRKANTRLKGTPAAKTKKAASQSVRSRGTKPSTEKLLCRYCGSDDLAPSFQKRRDARCRACFKNRYGSAARKPKVVRTRKVKAAK